MQLVILAAGHGRRFGGLKQLVAVGPNGEAIMDYTAYAAAASGYDGVILVVREEILPEIREHVRQVWPGSLSVDYVCQAPIPGTAQAVAAAADLIDGPFAVANADDLYDANALEALRTHFAFADQVGANSVASRHVLVGYQLLQTVLTSGPVTRGLVDISSEGCLRAIVEHTVLLRDDGRFDAVPLPSNDSRKDHSAPTEEQILEGHEAVSMNLWGFYPRILDEIRSALERFDPLTAARPELLLPDVIGQLVESSEDKVHVVKTSARCIGITHPDDLAIVQDELALGPSPLRTLR